MANYGTSVESSLQINRPIK